MAFIITSRKKSHTAKSGKCAYDIKCITQSFGLNMIVNDADQFVCIDSHLYTPVTSAEVTVQYSV